jgi:putative membrane protein
MKVVLKIVIIGFTIMALPRFISGIEVEGFKYALLATLALALVNVLIKPVIKLVTLPVNIISLGLFGLVINGVLLWLVAFYVPGFDVASYKDAFFGALIVSGMNWVVSHLK